MKILLWDIETAPMQVTTWKLFKPLLSHQNIVTESTIICAAWKWLGDKHVEAVAVDSKAPGKDRAVVEALHSILSEADVIVGHNGDAFDLKKFNARAIFHGLSPIPPVRTIDTLKVARSVFAFNSNRLDYLCRYLDIGQKIHTDFGLWLDVMAGDKKALARMVRYNKHDVKMLEGVYLVLRPYIRNHPNENLHGTVEGCPTCGSKNFIKKGFKAQRSSIRQQYQCKECGAWFCGKTVKTVVMR